MEEKIKHLNEQEKKVYDWLEETGGSTVREIFIYLNINSPTKVLSNLHKIGLIEKKDCTRVNSQGKRVHYRKYYLRGTT